MILEVAKEIEEILASEDFVEPPAEFNEHSEEYIGIVGDRQLKAFFTVLYRRHERFVPDDGQASRENLVTLGRMYGIDPTRMEVVEITPKSILFEAEQSIFNALLHLALHSAFPEQTRTLRLRKGWRVAKYRENWKCSDPDCPDHGEQLRKMYTTTNVAQA